MNCRPAWVPARRHCVPGSEMQSVLSGLRIAGFPGRYLQGPGAVGALAHVIHELGGSSALVVCDDFVENAMGMRIRCMLQAERIESTRLRFPGECTRAVIAALAAEAADVHGAVVVGLGRRQDDRHRQGCREGYRCPARHRADHRLERFRYVEPDRAVRRGTSRRRRRTPRQKSRRRAGRQRRNRPGAHPLLSGGHRGRVIQDLRGSTVPAVWRPEFLRGASARCCWRAGRSLLRRDQRMRRPPPYKRSRGRSATTTSKRSSRRPSC
jgi:hypothetical protein